MPVAPVLFLDGGLGTSLEDRYGIRFSESTPLWSSHLLVNGERDVLLACQQDFGRVPVDILLTATYQVSVEGFSRTKTAQHPKGIGRGKILTFLEDAVVIAEQAKGPEASIALSLGPYGASMIPSQEYSGRYDSDHDSEEQLYQWHLARLEIFAEITQLRTRVAYLAFETVPRLDEIRAIRRLYSRSETRSSSVLGRVSERYWVSCVFPEEAALPDGSTVDELIETLFSRAYSDVLPWAVGINCTKLDKLDAIVEAYETAIARLVENGGLQHWPALVLYPDGTNGEVYNTGTKLWERSPNQESPSLPWASRFGSLVEKIRARQRWETLIVGGCCKASCVDLAQLRQRLENNENNE